MDGKLAVIGIGSMALWQASHLSDSVVGFEAETGQKILTRCGGLSIGTKDGPYITKLPETTRTNGVTVKATLDGRGAPTPQADSVPRDVSPAEIAETTGTVTEFFPGPFPNIVRSDAFPDLSTKDGHALLGPLNDQGRIYCATGLSGGGFKRASGFGEVAASEALGKRSFDGLDFVRPQRFKGT